MTNKIGKCPVCKIVLSPKHNSNANAQECSSCGRTYYPNIQNENTNKKLQNVNEVTYDDIETVSSSGYSSGPLLVSSAHDKDEFVLKSETKEDEYEKNLRKHFGSHVTITTEVDVPS